VRDVAGSGPETQNARRRDVRPDAVGQTPIGWEAGLGITGAAPSLRKARLLEKAAGDSSNGSGSKG